MTGSTDPHMFEVPELPYVKAIRAVTWTLAALGYSGVCCGGAARDAWHNKRPKDLDFILLADPLDSDVPHDFRIQVIIDALLRTPDMTDVGGFLGYTGEPTDLDWVIKAKYRGTQIDIISPARPCYTVHDAIMGLDCTLNAAWFELLDVGAECHIMPGMYPDMLDVPSVRLLYPQSCTAERIAYLQSKYPQYRYDIQPDELKEPHARTPR